MADEKDLTITEDAEVEEKEEDYEEVCYVCRRPESKTGKMIRIPGQFSICMNCLQRSFDSMESFGINPEDLSGLGMDLKDLKKFPNINIMRWGDMQGEIPKKQKVKKKKAKEAESSKPAFDLKSIPSPHKIKAGLDEYVVGQDHAKKVVSVAVYNHYKRVAAMDLGDVDIEKSNMLMIGPTGSGKTYLVRTLAKMLNVPLAIADATSLTEAGYIGDDIESVVSKLLAAANNDVEKAERGIIFIDEIDKIAKKKNVNQRDVSGESVQQGMLKLLEGSEVEVPVGANSKNAMVPLVTVNTRNILFICGGAFPDLEDVIKERLNKQASIGFQADLKDKYDEEKNLISKVTVEDLRKFGMIPEFLGRLPIVFTLEELTKDMLVQILQEPKNAILKQYKKLLELDEVLLEFNEGALECIAEKALEKDTGARALRAIIEEFMLDIMYQIPKDNNIGKVTITREYIENTGGPIIEMRTAVPLEARPVLQIEESEDKHDTESSSNN
ncbi:MAG: ATP-dependent Clp protease ATP-binding subunit ClpX [Lachnospiraceae bacterium]|nr:ATP-dependent Clp protease ATP-binding subunit ClpX [Lachnospiraceae bacterium]